METVSDGVLFADANNVTLLTYDGSGGREKSSMCVLKIPVWFCNETDTERGRGRGRATNVKLHSTQDGPSLPVIHYMLAVVNSF